MDERLEIETPFGPVWLRGRITGRPAMIVLHGAFAERDAHAAAALDGADVIHAHLPGNHCPPLAAPTLGVWARAYSVAISTALPARRLGIVGLSTGALIALAMRQPAVCRMVLVEPPLRPHLAWPFRRFPAEHPGAEEMLWSLFGVSADRSEPRDYSHLLGGLTAPAVVLLGGVPLDPERPCPAMPSLVDSTSRTDLAAHPLVEVREVAGVGHNIPRDAAPQLLDAIRELRRAIVSPAIPAVQPG